MTSSPPQQHDSPPDFGSSFPQSSVKSSADVPSESNPQESPQSAKQYAEGTVQPPRHRQPQSQYYIVFSVTGIERSNVKNPIIRFDAKVCHKIGYFHGGVLIIRIRQTSPDSVPRLSGMSGGLIMNW